jgi:hypothetical protein
MAAAVSGDETVTAAVSVSSGMRVYHWGIMHRRSLAALSIALLLGLTTPAWAQGNGNGNGEGNGQDNGNPNSQDNGNGQGNGNNGQGNGNRNNGNAYVPGNGGNDQGNGNNGAVNPSSGGNGGDLPLPNEGVEFSQDDVLAAVEAGSTVSLETILPDVRTRTGGEVIDAKLQWTRGFLIYAVTVLTPAGKVVTEHYYARSGVHVEGR